MNLGLKNERSKAIIVVKIDQKRQLSSWNLPKKGKLSAERNKTDCCCDSSGGPIHMWPRTSVRRPGGYMVALAGREVVLLWDRRTHAGMGAFEESHMEQVTQVGLSSDIF